MSAQNPSAQVELNFVLDFCTENLRKNRVWENWH